MASGSLEVPAVITTQKTWSNSTEKLLGHHFPQNWSPVSAGERRSCLSPDTPPPSGFSLLREASDPSYKSLLSLLPRARENYSRERAKGRPETLTKGGQLFTSKARVSGLPGNKPKSCDRTPDSHGAGSFVRGEERRPGQLFLQDPAILSGTK